MVKDEIFQMRISEDDRRRMRVLANRYGISMAGVLRMYLREAVSDEDLAKAERKAARRKEPVRTSVPA